MPVHEQITACSAEIWSPFVKVGDQISSDTVVCMVEAMKVFNEVKAECGGTIDRVLVKSGESVEFGQGLFLVRPA